MTYKQNTQDMPTLSAFKQITNKDFYTQGGIKKIPSAKVINYWAKAEGISTETLEMMKNDDFVIAKVRAWIGKKLDPIMEETSSIIYNLKQEYERKLTEYIQKNIKDEKITNEDFTFVELNGVYHPRLNEPAKHIEFWVEWQRFLTFSERDAESKARRRAQLALLGVEYRDEEEIKSEKAEMESVSSMIIKEIENRASELGTKNFDSMWNRLCKQYKTITKEYLPVDALNEIFENISDSKCHKHSDNTDDIQKLDKMTSKSVENYKDALLKADIASQAEIMMWLVQGEEQFLKIAKAKLEKHMDKGNVIMDIPDPEPPKAPEEENPMIKDPIKYILNIEASKVHIPLDAYNNALWQYFANHNMQEKFDIAKEVVKRYKKLSRVTVSVYRFMIKWIIDDEEGFIDAFRNFKPNANPSQSEIHFEIGGKQ